MFCCPLTLFSTDLITIAKTGTVGQGEHTINTGKDANARAETGAISLIIAARYSTNPELLSILIKAGVDSSVKAGSGKTAFDYAKDNLFIKRTAAYWELNETQLSRRLAC
jgi:ankyrin repeat protein